MPLYADHTHLQTCRERSLTCDMASGDAPLRLQVLFSKFGFAFTELQLQGDEYILAREGDIIGVMPRKDAIADDVPELQPLYDRVLVKVNEAADVTSGAQPAALQPCAVFY